MNPIGPFNFDIVLGDVLRNKGGKNIVRARYHLDDLAFELRSKYAVAHVASLGPVEYVLYRISYWETVDGVMDTVRPILGEHAIIHTTEYVEGEHPGVLFLRGSRLDTILLSGLLTYHYNYEQAEEPSIDMRLQLYVVCATQDYLFDFYDDRGFDRFDPGADEFLCAKVPSSQN